MGENLIKQTCKELGITQKELAELLDVSVETVNKASAAEPSKQVARAIELLLEVKTLKGQLQDLEALKALLKRLTM